MAEALRLLRDYITSGREGAVSVRGEFIVFGDEVACGRGSKSNFYSTTTSTTEPYSLDALLFCYQTRRLGMGEYLQECRKAGYPSVAFVDRRDLLNYLTGETSTSTRIDLHQQAGQVQLVAPQPVEWLHPITYLPIPRSVPAPAHSASAQQQASSASSSTRQPSSAAGALPALPAAGEDRAAKRQKTSGEDDLSAGKASAVSRDQDKDATKEIMSRERALRDRQSILLSQTTDFRSAISLLESVSAQRHEMARVEPPPKSDFQINTAGSFLSSVPPPPSGGGSVRASTQGGSAAPLPPPSDPHPNISSKSSKSNPGLTPFFTFPSAV